MSNRFAVSATLVALVAVVAIRSARAAEGPAAQAPFVAVARVIESPNIEVKRYAGHVSTAASVNLVARVSGELRLVSFREGEIVEKGEVLYELDPVRYEAEVKNAEARIAEYQARLTYAELSYSRASGLYERNAGTKDSMDSSEAEHRAAKAALAAAEAQLVTAEDDLANTRIVAPITGKIGVNNFTVGNYLTSGSGTLATIVQLDPLRVNFSMSNRDYLSMFGTEENLKRNADLQLRLADDRLYGKPGKIEFIDNMANQRTDTIQIYAEFPNPDGKLVPGSTVTVLLSRRNGGDLPAVIPSAIMHDSNTAYVYVVDRDNKVERRDVVLGFSNQSLQLVTSGLYSGELVVVDGTHKTMPGGVIEPDFQDMEMRVAASLER